jgi:hypothetical protein
MVLPVGVALVVVGLAVVTWELATTAAVARLDAPSKRSRLFIGNYLGSDYGSVECQYSAIGSNRANQLLPAFHYPTIVKSLLNFCTAKTIDPIERGESTTQCGYLGSETLGHHTKYLGFGDGDRQQLD